MSPSDLYIMTDAEGFTTCIEASVNKPPRDNEDAMLREFSRRPMVAPITCYYWRRVGFDGARWKFVYKWEWSPHGS